MDGWRHKKRNIAMPFRFFKGKRKVPGQRGNSTGPSRHCPAVLSVACVMHLKNSSENGGVCGCQSGLTRPVDKPLRKGRDTWQLIALKRSFLTVD